MAEGRIEEGRDGAPGLPGPRAEGVAERIVPHLLRRIIREQGHQEALAGILGDHRQVLPQVPVEVAGGNGDGLSETG